jgi:heme exporter protein CcmD
MNIARFLEMGGYAVYVWPCYALTALVAGLNVFWARRALHAAQDQARRRMRTPRAAAS